MRPPAVNSTPMAAFAASELMRWHDSSSTQSLEDIEDETSNSSFDNLIDAAAEETAGSRGSRCVTASRGNDEDDTAARPRKKQKPRKTKSVPPLPHPASTFLHRCREERAYWEARYRVLTPPCALPPTRCSGKRNTFTQTATKVLEAAFQCNPYPSQDDAARILRCNTSRPWLPSTAPRHPC